MFAHITTTSLLKTRAGSTQCDPTIRFEQPGTFAATTSSLLLEKRDECIATLSPLVSSNEGRLCRVHCNPLTSHSEQQGAFVSRGEAIPSSLFSTATVQGGATPLSPYLTATAQGGVHPLLSIFDSDGQQHPWASCTRLYGYGWVWVTSKPPAGHPCHSLPTTPLSCFFDHHHPPFAHLATTNFHFEPTTPPSLKLRDGGAVFPTTAYLAPSVARMRDGGALLLITSCLIPRSLEREIDFAAHHHPC